MSEQDIDCHCFDQRLRPLQPHHHEYGYLPLVALQAPSCPLSLHCCVVATFHATSCSMSRMQGNGSSGGKPISHLAQVSAKPTRGHQKVGNTQSTKAALHFPIKRNVQMVQMPGCNEQYLSLICSHHQRISLSYSCGTHSTVQKAVGGSIHQPSQTPAVRNLWAIRCSSHGGRAEASEP